MRKSTKVILTVMVCVLVIAAIVAGIMLLNEQKKHEAEVREAQRQEQEYQDTLQAVSVLNEKSYFHGYQMLGDTPEGFYSHGRNRLVSAEEDTYHCFQYQNREKITQICLRSDKTHVFGIGVGDSKQDAIAVIEAEGYVLDEQKDNICDYVNNHVSIRLILTAEGKIEEIGINVIDPYTPAIVY